MKNIKNKTVKSLKLIAFLFLFAISQQAKSQWVTIPDANFRTWLNANGYSSAMSGNQMDTTNSLITSATVISIFSTSVSNLTGVQYFDNLQTLYVMGINLSILPALPVSLTQLYCYNNQLTSLPVLPNSLSILMCSQNLLTSLPTLPNSLLGLYCDDNNLISLPTLPNSLSSLYCNNNNLTSLPSLPSSITGYQFDCSYNNLTSLPALPPNLTQLYCFNNQLTSLPTLPSNLLYLYCQNNLLTSLPSLPSSLDSLTCQGNPNLHCLPDLKNLVGLVADAGTNILCIPNIANLTGSWLTFPICAAGNANGCWVYGSCVPTSSSFSQTIACSGSYLFNGYNLNVAGAYNDTLTNYHGCDSIITLNLTVTAPANSVLITDTNFVNWLNGNGYSSAMCGSYMDTTNSVVISATSINCNNQNIFDLTGVQFFDNLQYLSCDSNQLSSLPKLSNSLRYLGCWLNQITSLPALPDSLKNLHCWYNQLTSLPTLPNGLIGLVCPNNPISSLPVLPNSLKHLDCGNTSINSLPTLPNGLQGLVFMSNQISVLPTLPNSLLMLNCSYNPLTALPILPNSLQQLYSVATQLNSLPSLPNSLQTLYCYSNPNLFCLPGLNNITSLQADTNGTNILCIPNTANLTGSWLSFPVCAAGNVNGCLVCTTSTSSFPQSICSNQTYFFNGNNLNATGAYNDTLVNYHGCDSIITLNLTVNSISSSSFTQSIYCGISYFFNGNNYNATGAYNDTMTNYLGCDSIITMNLIAYPPFSTSSFPQSICSGSSILFNGNNLTVAGAYNDTLTNYLGCDSIITMNLTVNPSPTASFTAVYHSCFHSDSCATLTYTGIGVGSYNYLWNFNGGTGNNIVLNPTVCFAATGTHTINLTVNDNSNGCSANATDTVAFATDCVWPGDADYNGTVDNLDIFPIGLGASMTGPVRTNASLVFIDQPATTYGSNQASGADWKHADTNGDGIIDGNDTTAIVLNYGLVHPKLSVKSGSGLLAININPDTVYNNTTATATISLGTASIPLDSIYGVAFSFMYDTTVVDKDSVFVNIPSSWLFATAGDHWHITKQFVNDGKVEVGIVRNDHIGKSGFGDIAVISMDITTDDLSGKPAGGLSSYRLNCTLGNVMVIDLLGNPVPVTIQNDSAVVRYQKADGVAQLAKNKEQLSIYPNPVIDNLKISEFENLKMLNASVTIFDLLGRNRISIINLKSNIVNVSSLPSGVYFLKVTDAKGNIRTARFVKE